MNEELKVRIEKMIQSAKVFLFMKGTPDMPMCGFSLRVVTIVQQLNVPFGFFNVLEDEEVRNGIKEYASWPTIPQLYIGGEFIGGADITEELYESGELQKKIKMSQ